MKAITGAIFILAGCVLLADERVWFMRWEDFRFSLGWTLLLGGVIYCVFDRLRTGNKRNNV